MVRHILQPQIVVAMSLCLCGALGRCQMQIEKSTLPAVPREQIGSHGSIAPLAEIDDPHSGVRWQLMRDPSHPGGPGVLTQMLGKGIGNGIREKQGPFRQSMVIRAGDRVVIDEDSSVAVIHLEGVAIRSASIGSDILVRLIPGGSLFHAVVLGPGRASLAFVQGLPPEAQP